MSVSGEGTVGKFVLRTFNGIICVSTVLCGVDVKKWVANPSGIHLRIGGRMVGGGPGFRPRVFTLYLVGRQRAWGGTRAGATLSRQCAAADMIGGVPPLGGGWMQPLSNV